jgi:RHS repeat-associated protein
LKRLSGMKRKFHVPFFGGKSPARGLPTRRMQMEGTWTPAVAVCIPYLYNGIEHVSDLGLDMNTALFRTLDPALGRWWQIDPKAESFAGMSPYNSMGNNPVIASDPNGDTFGTGTEFLGQLAGAVVGTIANALGGKYKNVGAFALDLVMNVTVAAINGAIAECNPSDYNFDFGSAGVSFKLFFGTDGVGLGVEAGASFGYGNHRIAQAYVGATLYASAIGTNRMTSEMYAGVGVGYAYVTGTGKHSREILTGGMLRSTVFWTADGETDPKIGGAHFLFPSNFLINAFGIHVKLIP